jgi:hypothetical protein
MQRRIVNSVTLATEGPQIGREQLEEFAVTDRFSPKVY